jgi:myo-inositol-1(or 4)-monophosphatase
MSRQDDLDRIQRALDASAEVLKRFKSGAVEFEHKTPGDPVTEADNAVDELLRSTLPRDGEGWLSEETADSAERLGRERVWIVDPLDGTREFVQGIPEWGVSIGLVEGGVPVAGGFMNVETDQCILGSLETGVTLNGEPVRASAATALEGITVLASNSEIKRGEWERFEGMGFTVKPCGSVAYKLALVAAGLADATWTLVPKHEWDVAAGVALVNAAGGAVRRLSGEAPRFNAQKPKLDGLIATGGGLRGPVDELLGVGR